MHQSTDSGTEKREPDWQKNSEPFFERLVKWKARLTNLENFGFLNVRLNKNHVGNLLKMQIPMFSIP